MKWAKENGVDDYQRIYGKARSEFITHLRSSKADLVLTLDGYVLDEWKFSLVGIFSVFELCIEGVKPPWTVSLSKEDVSKLLAWKK